MDVIKLTKQLISIPSWVDKKTDERKIGEFIYGYLKQFKWLEVIKQPIINNRFNIIAKNEYPTNLLLLGHMDTVQQKQGWKTDPLDGVIKNGRIYGLGAADMKGNLSAILASLANIKKTKGLMLVFYIDEEYDFLGTKKFLKEYKNKIKPKLIISGDSGNLKIGQGCRGLIEIDFKVRGITGHAANPALGKNTILGSFQAIEQVRNYFKDFSTESLGKTSLNLAYLQGGLDLGQDRQGNQKYGREGNNIPDLTEFIIDIRPASLDLTTQKIISKMAELLGNGGLTLIQTKVSHDLKPWLTKDKDIKRLISLFEKEGCSKRSEPGKRGFIDVQMFWETFKKVPCLTFGAGEEFLAHKPNEFVKITELKKATQIYTKIIKDFTIKDES